jgi:hypothetical protein
MLPIKDLIYTITADNGKEFSFHEKIADKLNIFIYFANLTTHWKEVLMKIPMDSLDNTSQRVQILGTLHLDK